MKKMIEWLSSECKLYTRVFADRDDRDDRMTNGGFICLQAGFIAFIGLCGLCELLLKC